MIQSRLRLVCVVYTWDLSLGFFVQSCWEIFLALLVLHFVYILFFFGIEEKADKLHTIDHGFQSEINEKRSCCARYTSVRVLTDHIALYG